MNLSSLFKYFRSGIVIGATASLPTVDNALGCPMVYDTSTNTLKAFINGAWTDVGSGGGGGGGSLQWIEDSSIGPVALGFIDNNIQVYGFTSLSDGGGNLMTLIKVPTSYKPGKPIGLNMDFYSPDSSGNVLMQTLSTLIREATDVMSTSTNQRTSTNAAVTLSGATVNKPQAVAFDLTDTSGQINGVAVSPGDFIKVQLFRGTDTAVSDVNVPVFGAEETFS